MTRGHPRRCGWEPTWREFPSQRHPGGQNIDKTWPSLISRHLEKIAQTIPKSMSGEHSLANATQRPKHRQNIDLPGQPTPRKSRPNHLQKHAWRAFPGQRHPEAKTLTKHGPAWSADTWKKSPEPFAKACLESIPRPTPPRGQNIDETWLGLVSQHPNYQQKYFWRALPVQSHPEAKTSTKHCPAQ